MAYPPQLPPTTRTDATISAQNHASDHNRIAAALRDLVLELGASPRGGYANLTERLLGVAAGQDAAAIASFLEVRQAVNDARAAAEEARDAAALIAIGDADTTLAALYDADTATRTAAARAARIAGAELTVAPTSSSRPPTATATVATTTVAKPVGGGTVDTQARASLSALLDALRTGVVPEFTPLELAPHAWYDTSQLAGANGDAVATLPDLSGNGRNLTQATAAKRPTIADASIGGRRSLRFTAANAQSMASAAFAAVAGGLTVLAVAKHAQATRSATAYVADSAGSAGSRRSTFLSTGGYYGGQVATSALPTYTVDGTRPQVVTWRNDGAQTTTRVSGLMPDKSSADVPNSTPTAWRMGASYNDGGHWDGWIGELIILDRYATTAEIASGTAYLARKWGVATATPGKLYIDTVNGNALNHGYTPDQPLKGLAGILSTRWATEKALGAQGLNLIVRAPASEPLRHTAASVTTWTDALPLTVESWDAAERWHHYGSFRFAGGWTETANPGVWRHAAVYDNPLTVVVETMPAADGGPLKYRIEQTAGVYTNPGVGEYGHQKASEEAIYLRLPGDANPNDHVIEVAAAINGWIANGPGLVTLKRAALRYFRGACAIVNPPTSTPVGSAGFLDLVDCLGEYAFDVFATSNHATRVRAWDTVARGATNDGFNHHAAAGVPALMELYGCEGAYNGDEGASPHDDTVLVVEGGAYHHNYNGGGITGVDRARMVIRRPAIYRNKLKGAASDQGGVSYYDSTMSGHVEGLIAVGNNGPGLYVKPGAAVTVAGEVLSGTDNGNNVADVRP